MKIIIILLFIFLNIPFVSNSQSYISFGVGFSEFSRYNSENTNFRLSPENNIIPLFLIYNKRLNNNLFISGGAEYQIYYPFKKSNLNDKYNSLKIPLNLKFQKINSKFYFLSGFFLKNNSVNPHPFNANNFIGFTIGTGFNLTKYSKYQSAFQIDIDHNLTNTSKTYILNDFFGTPIVINNFINEFVINIRYVINLHFENKKY